MTLTDLIAEELRALADISEQIGLDARQIIAVLRRRADRLTEGPGRCRD